ncbi:MAG: RNA-guided endonuclease TnpB family protein [Haloarculaceae archaeon]
MVPSPPHKGGGGVRHGGTGKDRAQYILGVDLNVNQLAVTSTGGFWTGKEFDHWRREYENRRGDLQQCGSRHAHENIHAVGRRETGRFKILLHWIANGIIEEAVENGCTVIAFEELTGIRDRLSGASWGHKWAFERLSEYVQYKTEMHGIDVHQVDPENTSRRCSTCGFTHPDNHDGEDFACLKCGYENHADYNAAKNIGLRYLRRNQTGDGGGAPVGVRLNRGTVNANGDYDPSAGSPPRAGVHAKAPPSTKRTATARNEVPRTVRAGLRPARISRERVGWGSLRLELPDRVPLRRPTGPPVTAVTAPTRFDFSRWHPSPRPCTTTRSRPSRPA